MGKRIISQARGKGSLTYRVRRKAFKYKIGYPNFKEGEKLKGKVLKLVNSGGHSAPLAKIETEKQIFFVPAAKNLYEGQEIEINGKIQDGNIVKLGKIPVGRKIFNVELRYGDGGKIARSSGSFATILAKEKGKVKILLSSKKEMLLDEKNLAIIGEAAGSGRKEKPLIKAGKKHHIMRAKGKLWPRTSAVKVNAVDHPFGGGRGKRIKSKISKLNAPPGRKVGLLRPRRTGKRRGK